MDKGKTMWYEFEQNNSGGIFDIGDVLDVKVFVEADRANAANDIAENHGIYFDGCYNNMDCSCCGDRWNTVGECSYEKHEKIPVDKYTFNWSDTIAVIPLVGKPFKIHKDRLGEHADIIEDKR